MYKERKFYSYDDDYNKLTNTNSKNFYRWKTYEYLPKGGVEMQTKHALILFSVMLALASAAAIGVILPENYPTPEPIAPQQTVPVAPQAPVPVVPQ
ncbi:MAG TPA: hypothetical protein EYP35_03635, partial [Desulfobacterales bacterium]|nr:hypothetical protein [Desulfobacterales bacterium]